MKISISCNIFETIEQAIKVAKEVGYEGLEVRINEGHLPSNTSDDRAKEIKVLLDKSGLTVPCIAAFVGGYATKSDAECEEQLAEFEKFLKLAQKIDCGMVRQLVGGPRPADAKEEDFKKIAKWLQKSADLAGEYGIRIAMEMHADHIIEGVDSALKLMDMLHKDNVGLIFEPGNMCIVNEAHGFESVKRLSDNIFHVHVKDLIKVPDNKARFEARIVGEGEVEFLSAFKGLKDIGYNGHLILESAVSDIKGEELAKREYEGITKLLSMI